MLLHFPIKRAVAARWVALGATLAGHALLVALLYPGASTLERPREMAPMMARLITPEMQDLPAPRPQSKHEPKLDRASARLPVRQAQAGPEPEAASPSEPVLATPAPAPSAASESGQAVAAAPPPGPAAPVAARAPAELPAPLVPPSFNAGYLDNPAPAYPALSRRAGEQGRVMLRVFVETSGLPSKVEIRSSSGSERLDQAALEAVRRWKFVPARQGEQAVPAHVIVPISFSLKG